MVPEPVKRKFLQLFRPLYKAVRELFRGGWKRRLLTLALAGGILMGGAVLYAWTGLISISASSGHWAVTYWYLHFSMRSAVRTQALGIDVPELGDPAMVLKGAGHFATGCAPCHGAPGQPQSLIAAEMAPAPPLLSPRIKEWTPAELFWIVRHGIKFTAMPAWPSLRREDEVWSMVAFLRQLPSLEPEEYRQLAYGERASADPVLTEPPAHLQRLEDLPGPVLDNCARCHGADGAGRRTGAFPKLADQSEEYLLASLLAYANGKRHSGIMQPVAAGLSEAAMRTLAGYYAEQEFSNDQTIHAGSPGPAGHHASITRGEAIAKEGRPGQGIPSCIHCHGPRQGPRNPYYPNLAGQYADYLALQLSLFQSNKRGGTPYGHIMHAAARHLDPGQIRDLALYYASLRPGDGPGTDK